MSAAKGHKRSQTEAFNDEDEEWELKTNSNDDNDDDDDSDYQEPPSKRQRRSKTTSNTNKKPNNKSNNKNKNTKKNNKKNAKKNKKTPKAAKLTKKSINEIKKTLNQHVKTFAKMVNLDWHDGWEEQGEELICWYNSIQSAINIIDIYCLHSINNNITFDTINKCNELLKIINDTWNNINAVPMRGDINENITCSDDAKCQLKFQNIGDNNNDETSEITFQGDIDGLLSYLWKIILLRASGMDNQVVTDSILMRFIKDAYDNGVTEINNFKQLITDDDDEYDNVSSNDDNDSDSDSDSENGNKENKNDVNNDDQEKDSNKDKNKNQEKEKENTNDNDEKIDINNNNNNNKEVNKMIKGTIIKYYPVLKCGVTRLNDIFINRKNEWKSLPNVVKVHKMRRGIDRRFDGALHLRTRDYHLYDNFW